jgi:hypothetical protein
MSTVSHVPAWVFVLLAALIAFGVKQAFPRRMTLERSIVLPLALCALSLFGIARGFGDAPLAVLAWFGGLGLALAALHGRIDTSRVVYSAARRSFQLPGSWLPLGLMLAMFALKFALGTAIALQPALHDATWLALSAGALAGALSGGFLARSVALWRLALRQEATSPAALAA